MQQYTSRSREETDCKADHALCYLIELNDLALAASPVKICIRECHKYINLTQVLTLYTLMPTTIVMLYGSK
jgi:hypothetical protein